MTENNKLFLLLAIVLFGWLFYQLSPVLMPFFVAALLAYLGDPLVDWLEDKKLSRTMAVVCVFIILLLAGLLLLLILLPMLTSQLKALFQQLPAYFSFLQAHLVPWLSSVGFPVDKIDSGLIAQAFTEYGAQVGKMAGSLVQTMTRSGMVFIQWLINLVLIPVLTFYLLRDWDILVARFRELLPRRHAQTTIQLSLECDDILAAFIRGQLMVMLALAILYTTGLALIGLDLALLLGVIAGIVSFVPYLGLIVGIGLAGVAAFLQFHDWIPVLMVVLVFGVAQAIEGMVLTPRLVGERIGLHPVAVIFAVMAGGQLFGFAGVLLALPVAAVVMVLLRHVHQHYMDSPLYR